jgi:hypothetical protein
MIIISNRFVGIKDSTGEEWKLEENKAMPVNIQDQHTDSVDLDAHIDEALPSMTSDADLDDESITVDSVLGISQGQVIIIYEGTRFYQSLVVSVVGNDVNLASPLDSAFTTAAVIHIADWNLNVDGSSVTKIAHIFVPSAVKFDIYQINIAITDGAAMDSAKFGGISALTNGILFRAVNSRTKNLHLVVNNIGFSEQGFDISYDAKAPAGVYGFQAKKNWHSVNGISLRLDGSTGDELQCHIRDDLTELTMVNITVNGHVVTP